MEVSFDTTNFFDEFKFITFDDKTHGFVDYVHTMKKAYFIDSAQFVFRSLKGS